MEGALEQFTTRWEGLEDPRTGNAALHDFHELLMIALCATLCGGQSAVAMSRFAEAKETFLRGFLKLEHGLPSHDTFSRLFRQLDPTQFPLLGGECVSLQQAFRLVVDETAHHTHVGTVDGRLDRRTHCALHHGGQRRIVPFPRAIRNPG
ncbi:MAG: hypothetical protein B7X48_05225 [Acidiphilium sp. 34-60-192]|nr:MAG: hypothetical protein B7X48_05225 [Acidiphilium sp. 34-60-192]